MPVVTIRGQLGSGAPEIGKLVARSIGAEYVDREIIAQVAERVQREGKEIADKEMPPGTFLGRIVDAVASSAERGAGYQTIYLSTWEMPLEDAPYIEALTNTIRILSQTPSIVIHGRGSQFILKDYPGALHVLLVAPLETRVKRVAESLQGDEKKAIKDIERFDSSRRQFIKHYFHADLEDPVHHDLVINTDRYTPEAVVQIIVTAVGLRDQERKL